jgi:hypothetical protein
VILIYFIVNLLLFHFHKIYFDTDIVKYKLNSYDHKYLKMYSSFKQINEIKGKDIIFYSEYIWSSKNNNYIHDKQTDTYYIIDSGHYYYIPDTKRYTLTINKNINVFVFDLNKYPNKVVFL